MKRGRLQNLFLAIAAMLILMLHQTACDFDLKTITGDSDTSANAADDTLANSLEDLTKVEKPKVKIDTQYTNLARFIAGMDAGPQYESIQSQAYYQQHKIVIDREWDKINKENLLQIKVWIRENNITDQSDTTTLFYPFSGPDILYGNAFFPYCKNYILVGLEKAGSVPEITKLSDSIISKYLAQIRYSLRYTNKVGYFVTEHMMRDFSKRNLDGVLHVILFSLARSNHDIVNIEPFYIDSLGKPVRVGFNSNIGKRKNAIVVEFCKHDSNVKQTLYYIRRDMSDKKLQKKQEFVRFVTNFDKKISYTKSASYILHLGSFSTVRNLILNQSVKILQDDTGLPFRDLNTDDFQLTLFGNYTKTIKDFKHKYQPDLKKALDNQKEKHFLPFKIGYNAWYNETVLLFARAKKFMENDSLADTPKAQTSSDGQQQSTNKASANRQDNKKGVTFRVQIKTAASKPDAKSKEFAGLPSIRYYVENGVYKYTIGNTATQEESIKLQELARKKGFKGAFVVAFNNKQRIPLSEAKQLLSEK